WHVQEMSFEAWVSDLEAVVEATGVQTFDPLGISQSGPTAVQYAARHPERVPRLILYGTYARGRHKRGESEAELEAAKTLIRQGWGRDNPAYRQMFTSMFMPEATLEQQRWFNDLQRVSTIGENAARIQDVGSNIDVVPVLPEVRAPALVLHAKGDQRVPLSEGRLVAS